MDLSSLGITTVAAITVICLVAGMIAKASLLSDKWIPVICAVCGGILGAVGLAIMPDFPATDYMNAIAIGVVSGLTSTGIHQVVKQISKGE